MHLFKLSFFVSRITIFGIRGTFTGWVDSTLDFFTWNSNIPITTNVQTVQLSADTSNEFAWFFHAKSSFNVVGDSTFINDIDQSNIPTAYFKKFKVSFTGSVNPNGTSTSIWAIPWVAVPRNGWVCTHVDYKMLGSGRYLSASISFGNGDDWITRSYEQIYELPLDIAWVPGMGSTYVYKNGHYWNDDYDGAIVGFEIFLERNSTSRFVEGTISDLKFIYIN